MKQQSSPTALIHPRPSQRLFVFSLSRYNFFFGGGGGINEIQKTVRRIRAQFRTPRIGSRGWGTRCLLLGFRRWCAACGRCALTPARRLGGSLGGRKSRSRRQTRPPTARGPGAMTGGCCGDLAGMCVIVVGGGLGLRGRALECAGVWLMWTHVSRSQNNQSSSGILVFLVSPHVYYAVPHYGSRRCFSGYILYLVIFV